MSDVAKARDNAVATASLEALVKEALALVFAHDKFGQAALQFQCDCPLGTIGEIARYFNRPAADVRRDMDLVAKLKTEEVKDLLGLCDKDNFPFSMAHLGELVKVQDLVARRQLVEQTRQQKLSPKELAEEIRLHHRPEPSPMDSLGMPIDVTRKLQKLATVATKQQKQLEECCNDDLVNQLRAAAVDGSLKDSVLALAIETSQGLDNVADLAVSLAGDIQDAVTAKLPESTNGKV